MGFLTSLTDKKKNTAKVNTANSTNSQTNNMQNQTSRSGIGGGTRTLRNRFSNLPSRYNYQLKSRDQWTAADYAAYGRKTGDSNVFQELNTLTDTRGNRYWNPYRGGRAVLPDGCADFFKANFGYEGAFDQKFCDDYNASYGSDVRFTKAMGVATPTKKSSMEEWAGYYVTHVQDNLIENKELNSQWDEYRKALSDYYDQFEMVYGRAPTYDEFEASVDRSKYSKLKAVDDSLQYATKLQILPIGTYYSPDIITGLYQAKRNGKDINVDRDYFEDAVQYSMNPVQMTQSVQKYDWSNDNLSETTKEDRDKYLSQLVSKGNYEEAAAYDYAWFAAQPHADGVEVEPSPLDSNFGYYHDESWFSRIENSDIGDEYRARLNYDGTMDNPGKNGSLMDKVCWEYYQTQKSREKTLKVENECKGVLSQIQSFTDKHLADYSADEYEDFKSDILTRLDLEHNEILKPYLEDGYDPTKYCRDLHFSNNTINAAIKKAWDGEQLSYGIDYAAQVDDEYEPQHGVAKPVEISELSKMMYARDQLHHSRQRVSDRNNAEASITEAVENLAESGAVISKGSVPVTNSVFDRMLDFGDASMGVLGKLWTDVFGAKHSEKLGADYSASEAAAVDPVLAQLDVQNMPEALTTEDIKTIVNAKVMSRIRDDDICLADGIINYALPGAEHLNAALMERTNGIAKFNALTYRNVYNDRIAAGISERAAAEIAAFAATDLNSAVETVGNRYEGDKELTDATHRLLNDMAQEDGAKESYDIFMAISDDVHNVLSGDSDIADGIMQKLYPAMMVGSSEAATPGFRAETSQITHDIATGAISAQDVVDGLSEDNVWNVDFSKRQYNGQTVSEEVAKFLANGGSASETYNIYGTLYTRDEYRRFLSESKMLLKKSNAFWGTDRAFDSMSDELKNAIGYDAIVDTVQALHPDDAQYYIDDVVHSAIEDIVNPDALYHSSPLMHAATDFIGQLDELGRSKDDREIGANLVSNRKDEGRSLFADPYGWSADALQQARRWDKTGFFSAVSAFLSPLDPEFFEDSEQTKIVNLFKDYGKYFSRNEIDFAFDSFYNGKASFDEIENLVLQRAASVGPYKVSALDHPDEIEHSASGVSEGVDRLQSYSNRPINVESIVDRLMNGEPYGSVFSEYPAVFRELDQATISGTMDMSGVWDDQTVRAHLIDTLNVFLKNSEVPTAYTSEQLENIRAFSDLYRELGPDGYILASLDAPTLKNTTGIDLDGTGFENGYDLLNELNPDWAKPFTHNPGYEFGTFEAVGKGMAAGYETVLSSPAKAYNFWANVYYRILGKAYDPSTDNSPGGIAYRNFSNLEAQNAAESGQVATSGQKLTQNLAHTITELALLDAIGGSLQTKGMELYGSHVTGIPLAIENIAAANGAADMAGKIASRLPRASSMFLSTFDNAMKDGKDVELATIRALTKSAIHLSTNSAFQRWNVFSFAGSDLSDHAMKAAESFGGKMAIWSARCANNVVRDLGRAEALNLVDRIYDASEAIMGGQNAAEAVAKAGKDFQNAASDTALTSVLMTLILGAADLGGMVYDNFKTSIAEGKAIEANDLEHAISVDLAANQDVPTPEDIARAEMAGVFKYNAQYGDLRYEGTQGGAPVWSFTGEHADQMRDDVLRAQSADTGTIETEFTDNGGITVALPEKETKAYNPATDVPHFDKPGSTSPVDAAQEAVDKAVMDYYSGSDKVEPSGIISAVQDFQTAYIDDARETAQKTQEAASAQAEENPQTQQETSQQTTTALPENAQRMKDYVAHSEDAIDNAIIEKGAEMEAEKAVAEDAGLITRQESIEKLAAKIQDGEEKIAGMQQQAQTIAGQTEQMYRAALDSGLDAHSPQVNNAAFQLRQQQAAVESQIGQQQEKQNSMATEMQELQKQLEAEKERIAAEAKERAISDFAGKIKDFKTKKAEIDTEIEKAANRQRAEDGGTVVLSDFTNDQFKANAERRAQEKRNMTGTLMARAKRGQLPSTATNEAYTDPRKYTSPLVEARRDDEWKDESATNKYEIQAEETRQNMLLGDYIAGQASKGDTSDIPVDKATYYNVINAMKKRLGTVDTSQAYTRVDKGAPAKVTSIDDTAMAAIEAKAAANYRQQEAYDASGIMNEDGSITGTAAQMILEAATDTEAGTKTNPGDTFVHITENNQYLIVKSAPAVQQDSYARERYESLTRRASEDGLSGMERGEKKYEETKKWYTKAYNEMNNAAFSVLKTKNAYEAAIISDTTAKQKTEAAKAYETAQKNFGKAKANFNRWKEQLDTVEQRNEANQKFLDSYQPDSKHAEPYCIIDKSKITENTDLDAIAMKALYRASEQFAELRELSDDGFANYLLDAGYSQEAIDSSEPYELPFMYMDYLYKKAMSEVSSEAFSGAIVLRTGSMDSVNAFVAQHGGFAGDGETGGKGFASFTSIDDYNPNQVFYISERAAHEYLTEAQKKAVGIKRTAAQYNAAVNNDLDAYGQENNLSDEDMRYLRQQMTASTEGMRDKVGFYVVENDGNHELGILQKEKKNLNANSFLRDEDGNYSIAIAKQRLRDKLDWMVDEAKKEDRGEIDSYGKKVYLDVSKHNVQVKYIDGYGNVVARTVGMAYADEDGVSRWFPSYGWIMKNATEVTCNFYCETGYGNTGSRVNFKLYPANTHGEDFDLQAQSDPNAWMRSTNELQREVQKLEAFAQKISGTEYEMEKVFMNAWWDARFNLAKNQYYKALDAATKATPDSLQKAVDDVEMAKAEMDFFSGDFKSEQKQTTSTAQNVPASQRLAELKEMHEAITTNPIFSSIPGYKAQAAAIADAIPRLQEKVEQEAAEADLQEQPKRPDPTAEQIANTLMDNQDIGDTAKLTVLKNLSDSGADIADIRSQAIKKYHDKTMESMGDQERMDYVATLANQQKAHKDGYTIDPNADYEAQLGDLLNEQEKKANSKMARRLRDISRKAGSYKTAGGINRAMNELAAMEQAGHDVVAVREMLQNNLEALAKPNQQKIDAVIESVDEPELKFDLNLFADKGGESAVQEARDPAEEVVADILADMAGPKEIITGFEKTVEGLKMANSRIPSEESLRNYVNAIADAQAVISGDREQIDELDRSIGTLMEQREAAKKAAKEIRQRYVTPENNEKLDRIYEQAGQVYKEGPADVAQSVRHSYQLEADLALGDPANTWTVEQRDEYDKTYGQIIAFGRKIAEKMKAKDELIKERDAVNETIRPYKLAVLGSDIAGNIINNRAVYGPSALQVAGDTERAKIHRQRRQKMNENANGIIRYLEANSGTTDIFGKSTIITQKQIADAFASVIDEKQLAENKAIADAIGREVKELKTDIAIIDLAKAFLSGDEKAYTAAFEKSFDAIMELSPQKEFTAHGKAVYEGMQEKARRRLEGYISDLKKDYSIGNDGDALYTVLDQQKLAIEAAIDRAEQTAKNYYSLSAKGLYDVFGGNNGGHMPAEVVMTNYAIIRKSIKRHNPVAPVANLIDTFPRICEKLMGNNAKIFISQYVDPVREGEAMASRRFKELRSQYKWMDKVKKDVREAMTQARHYGWTNEYIRQQYGDDADTIISGVETMATIFDTVLPEINVSYNRNGIDPVKKRSNYIPLIQKEKNPVFRQMGIHASFEDIQTKDFGETDSYKPVHEFFRFAMERKSDNLEGCELDPVVLLDTYLPSALTQIYQTDNIVRMRDLIECINENADYDDLGKNNVGGMQNFRRYLTEYCNTVSGKKVGFIDRFAERTMGRRYFAWAQALTSIKGQSSTAGNLNVVIANFEPLTMCFGTNPTQTAQAIADTLRGGITGAGKDLVSQSDFLATRFADKNRAYTPYQKAVRGMYKLAELSDRFNAEVVWRVGYYNACTRLGIDPEGGTDLHKQARKNADNFAIKVMASKTRGEKAMMYNSVAGSMFGQFLQESTNNLRFMAKDAGTYAGGNAKAIGRFSGAVKAVCAILMALAGHELINRAAGREVLFSPYGPGIKAVKALKDGEKPTDTLTTFGKETWEGMNPYDNYLDSNSSIPLIGDIPVVNSIEQTFKNIVSAAKHGYNAADSKITGNEYYPNETDWFSDLANAILGWAPGGTAIKRLYDTGKIANQGYALSQKGRFKFTFDSNIGNVLLSAAFGPESSVEGREYTASGYKTQSDTNTQLILDRIKAGQSPLDAYNAVSRDKDTSIAENEATTAGRFGDENAELLDKAKSMREEQGQPKDLPEALYASVNEPWLKKGVDMWKESGLTTYPTELPFYTDPERGTYIKIDGRNVPLDEETVDMMTKEYYRNAKFIIEENDDPETVKAELNKLTNNLKKKYAGGE